MDEGLTSGWELAFAAPGLAAQPEALPHDLEWIKATVPGTAADALRAAERWRLDGPVRRFDAEDVWYRGRFPGAAQSGERVVLVFEGLATLGDVWLNGVHVLRSQNMFVAHQVDATPHLRADNEIYVRFAALEAALLQKRPRPRWRAPMVAHQQLRHIRTTLLGRTPGWSPPAAPVGPWRPVRVLRRREGEPVLERCVVQTDLNGVEGRVTLTMTGVNLKGLRVAIEQPGQGPRLEATVEAADEPEAWRAVLPIVSPMLWWPHTHGDQPLYDVRALATDGRTLWRRRIGFRSVALDTDQGEFSFSWNGVPVFFRGACWLPIDPVSLQSSDDELRAQIALVREAGMNMLRVSGTAVYESERFHELCDEMGVVVWQDFMFANMDYPDDDAFVASVRKEAQQLLDRLAGSPSLGLLCGDSEGEQQAAMWGAPRSSWHRPLFREVLPALVARAAPGVPYWPSSASGGAFPHQVDQGSSSYYGVGAYLRPLDDARRSGVRFASECLAFANVPSQRAIEAWTQGEVPRVHTPAWKSRVPRDLGAGWDFDDVRDHYLGRLFGVDPIALRSSDYERYLDLSRVVTGEVMAAVFSEWRRPRSVCRGALVWFLRDLWLGPGWGVLDAMGGPKACFAYLRRVLQPIAVFVSDEGLNGLALHVVNETQAPLVADLRLDLFRDESRVGGGGRSVTVGPRSACELAAASLLDGFVDTTWAYKFGPPGHDLVSVSLSIEEKVIGQAFYFPMGLSLPRYSDVGLEGTAVPKPGGGYVVTFRTRRFAQAISVEAVGFVPDDDHFHMAPGSTKVVHLRGAGRPAPLRAVVRALNAEAVLRLSCEAVA